MGIRAAVRGTSGDQMAQNIADLKAAGVDSPSVGLASGNSGLRALENTMARVPVSGGVLRENMQNAQNQLQRTANDTRDALSQRYGPLAAGNAIDKGIAEFAAQKQAKASSLYDQINIPWTSQFQTPALMNAVTDMTRPIPGAPAISTGILGKDSGLPALLKNQFNADQAATVGVPYQAIKRFARISASVSRSKFGIVRQEFSRHAAFMPPCLRTCKTQRQSWPVATVQPCE